MYLYLQMIDLVKACVSTLHDQHYLVMMLKDHFILKKTDEGNKYCSVLHTHVFVLYYVYNAVLSSCHEPSDRKADK